MSGLICVDHHPSPSFHWNQENAYLAYKQSQGGKHMLQRCGRLVDLEKEHVGVKDPLHH